MIAGLIRDFTISMSMKNEAGDVVTFLLWGKSGGRHRSGKDIDCFVKEAASGEEWAESVVFLQAITDCLNGKSWSVLRKPKEPANCAVAISE